MQSSTLTISAQVTTYRDGLGNVIGKVYEIDTTNVRLFVAEAHDWDGDNSGEYVPIGIGTYIEPSEAANEIERRARIACS